MFALTQSIFLINEIDKFFDDLSILLNDERFKRILIFKQQSSQTTRNFIIIISSTNNNQQYIIFSTFTTFNNNFSLFVIFISVSNSTFLFSAKIISSSSNDVFTSIFVDELTNNSTLQKIRLFNATNVESKQQRTFNYYSKLRFAKNLFVNSFIDLIALFNCDSTVIKTALTLLNKAVFVDFYESKTYKKAITNAQYKIN